MPKKKKKKILENTLVLLEHCDHFMAMYLILCLCVNEYVDFSYKSNKSYYKIYL